MRIFYAAGHTPNVGGLPGSLVWYYNLYLPLKDLGHDLIAFDYDLGPHYRNSDDSDQKQRRFIEHHQSKLEQTLLQQITEAHDTEPIDVFFSYFYDAMCRPEIIRQIGRMGICTINWFCNASYQFYLIENLGPAYDYCLVPEKFRLEDYKRIGANPVYFQEAANPNIYKPMNLPKEYDVTFVGQKYGDRPEYIRYLLDNGINVRVWGPGWQTVKESNSTKIKRRIKKLLTVEGLMGLPNFVKRKYSTAKLPNKKDLYIPKEVLGPTLSDEEMIQIYSRSRISLGFSSCGDTGHSGQPILQMRLRDFEAPMSGAFYMVQFMEELEEFFDIGKEIVCYHDKEDLAEKVKYYLSHDEEREKIRQAGYRRARNDHTWQKRFQMLFKQIGFV